MLLCPEKADLVFVTANSVEHDQSAGVCVRVAVAG